MYNVAVLMSTYNGEKYLSCQLDSILGQEQEQFNLEVIIRDDGSTDETINILKKYEQKYPNIKVFYEKNVGYIASFMKLIGYAKNNNYDFISLSDQDDRWDSNKIAAAIEMISDYDMPVLYQSRSRTVNENLEYIGIPPKPRKKITLYNTMIQIVSAGHTYVFNSKLLEELNEDIDCAKLYGHDAYITNVAVIAGKIIFDENAYTDYRQHNSNQLGTSNQSKLTWVKNRIVRLKKGHGERYGAQIAYLSEILFDKMDMDQQKEFTSFLNSRKNFFTRLRYVVKSKLYRQGSLENIAFKFLYLLGGYNQKINK